MSENLKAKSRLLVLSVVAAALSACAGATMKRDSVALESVKKVAIVALSADQPDREGGLFGTRSGGSTQPSEHMDRIYADLAQSLAKQLGWKVVTLAEVRANPTMTKTFESTMKGFQNKMPPHEGTNRYHPPGIPDFDAARIMRPAGRAALARDLNVDAVVVANLRGAVTGTTVMGVGTRRLQGLMSMTVYRGADETPIWFENFRGEDTKTTLPMSADKAKVDALLIEAFGTTFPKVRL
jgi:hypothetical protein